MNDDVLRLILTWKERQPAESCPHELTSLFGRLQSQPPIDSSYLVEDAIWEIWTGHTDRAAELAMNEAIAAIAQQNYSNAEALLTKLLIAEPDWPEAWNKRATLYFLMGRDAESIADIGRTLELEPRHFGAISGFAQICLRNSDTHSAISAMQIALEINPHLHGVKAALPQIITRTTHVTH